MQEPSALGRIVELVRDLRARCPWDAAQTPQTLRPYFVEEAAELDHALSLDDPAALRTELGDVLLHVAFQIVLAEESGRFGAEDLVQAVEKKMWRRHPHLFSEQGSKGTREQGSKGQLTAEAVKDSWERNKLKESAKRSVLDGLPPTLPALVAAFRLQEKAAGVGFDWPDAQGPAAKVREELEEVHGATVHAARESEIGDLLFAVVNLSRKLGVDPRAALEGANRKFMERFREVEKMAADRGLELGTVG
ncbi:MAG: nucleoside triphosphate pyrophosphohydrolase, partial [Gemmatimonadales bacterium]